VSSGSVSVHGAAQLDHLSPGSVVVVPFFEGDDLSGAEHVEQIGGEELRQARERGELRARRYRTTFIRPRGSAPGLPVVGAGGRDDLTPLIQSRVAGAASRFLSGVGYGDLAFVRRGDIGDHDFARASVEGAITGAYDVGLMKSKRKVRSLTSLSIVGSGDAQAGAELGLVVGESRNLARDLVNLPPNEITPSNLASRAADLASQYGLDYGVLGPDEMRQLGMGSLLGVAAGSREEPRLITLSYGAKGGSHLALVGKGLTFDSGGLSLKPANAMETMKSDMSGAAAVIGSMVAIARLKPQGVGVTGYIGATENMPGGGAMRPGDVLTAMTGETIEVLNTDAEGRLVLADVLSYAISKGATHIVDFATLTGAAIVALGHAATLAVGRPDDWIRQVVRAADSGLDRSWAMPLYEEYRRAMDSEVADIKNTGGRPGGALTASAFLADFTQGVSWAHMDIAGTAFREKAEAYADSGATGVGVGAAVALVRDIANG